MLRQEKCISRQPAIKIVKPGKREKLSMLKLMERVSFCLVLSRSTVSARLMPMFPPKLKRKMPIFKKENRWELAANRQQMSPIRQIARPSKIALLRERILLKAAKLKGARQCPIKPITTRVWMVESGKAKKCAMVGKAGV